MDPDLIKVLAWPAAVVVLGLGALIALRANFARLLDRTQQIGKTGLIAHAPQQQVPPEPATEAVTEFMAVFDNALLVQQETSIRDDIRTRGLEGKVEAEKVLVRTLAATQISLHFERVYASIFPTQIELLHLLNRHPDGLTVKEMKDAFAEYLGKKHKDVPFDEWLAYPESWGLTARRDESVQITEWGREFLKYLVETRKASSPRG